MAERIVSAGVVIVRQADKGWRVLLLRAYNYWDFPKGQLWWSRHDPDFKELLDTRKGRVRFPTPEPYSNMTMGVGRSYFWLFAHLLKDDGWHVGLGQPDVGDQRTEPAIGLDDTLEQFVAAAAWNIGGSAYQ
jgi:hypothetical protein